MKDKNEKEKNKKEVREQAKIELGYAEVDITPQVPIEMVGFGRPDEKACGIKGFRNHPAFLLRLFWLYLNEAYFLLLPVWQVPFREALQF
jgi:hypothetical protein